MTEQVYKSWAIIPRGLEPFHKGKFALLQQSDILPLAQATICWKLWSYLGIVAITGNCGHNVLEIETTLEEASQAFKAPINPWEALLEMGRTHLGKSNCLHLFAVELEMKAAMNYIYIKLH